MELVWLIKNWKLVVGIALMVAILFFIKRSFNTAEELGKCRAELVSVKIALDAERITHANARDSANRFSKGQAEEQIRRQMLERKVHNVMQIPVVKDWADQEIPAEYRCARWGDCPDGVPTTTVPR